MQLLDNHALGAVDHERAVAGHQRHFAHVDFLLADVLDGAGVLVIDHQTHQHPQRGRVGQAAQLTFLDVKCRLADAITHVLKACTAGVTLDREDRIESGMQALRVARVRVLVKLQEVGVRLDLRCQQIGDIQNLRLFAKIVADALFFSKRIGHRGSSTRLGSAVCKASGACRHGKHPQTWTRALANGKGPMAKRPPAQATPFGRCRHRALT